MRWLQAYKNYVKTLLTRKNTITGVVYSEDPTVFAWELANEPATSADYEINLGIKPGSLVYNWLDEMSAFVKGLAPNHMVSTTQAGCRCCCCCYCPALNIRLGYIYLWEGLHTSGISVVCMSKTHLACSFPCVLCTHMVWSAQRTKIAPEGAHTQRMSSDSQFELEDKAQSGRRSPQAGKASGLICQTQPGTTTASQGEQHWTTFCSMKLQTYERECNERPGDTFCHLKEHCLTCLVARTLLRFSWA